MPVKEMELPLRFRVNGLCACRVRASSGHKCHECGCLVLKGEECYLVYTCRNGRLDSYIPYAVHKVCAPGHFNLIKEPAALKRLEGPVVKDP